MATATEINTGILNSCVSDIRGTRGQMEGVVNDAAAIVSSLGGSWQGNAANQFNSTFGQARQKLTQANDVIEQYAQFLVATIEEYEAAEQARQQDNASFEGGQ